MKKLKDTIETILYKGRFPAGIMPYMTDVLISVYNNLLHGENAEFIESSIKSLMDKCGIKTKENGIGYIAYR